MWNHEEWVVHQHHNATGEWVQYADIVALGGEVAAPETPTPEEPVVTPPTGEDDHAQLMARIEALEDEVADLRADYASHLGEGHGPDVEAPGTPAGPGPAPDPQPEPETPSESTPEEPVPAPNQPAPPVGEGGWREDFNVDGSTGMLDRTWGHTYAHDGVLDVASWAGEQWAPSGAMTAPTGADAGWGYGTYTVSMAQTGGSGGPGIYAAMWPSSDVWPGPELDFVERDFEGNAYSAVHTKGEDGTEQGADHYTPYYMPGVDVSQFNEYSMKWDPGRLTMTVNGEERWTTTKDVPADFAHGGENSSFGIGTQPGWAQAYQDGDVVLTVDYMSYSPLG